MPKGEQETVLLSAFLAQYYIGKYVPPEIIVNALPEDTTLLEEVFNEQAGRRIRIHSRVRAERLRWLQMAQQNAKLALDARLASKAGMLARFEALQKAFNLEGTPARIECFDISHTGGEQTVASCVVFDSQGAIKSDYRRFNIEGICAGDDCAAMKQAIHRRYIRLQSGEGKLPDLLLIDGGNSAAAAVLSELNVKGVAMLGVAKGADRKPGLEQLFLFDQQTPIILPPNSLALHLIQQIRDEAHRFAITGHRQRRERSRTTSILEDITGIGPKRRQRLLKKFGGMQELSRAGVNDLSRVDGISRSLAQKIYKAFHEEE